MKSFTVFSYLGHIKLTMWEYRRHSNGRNSNNFINETLATNTTSQLQPTGEILTVRVVSRLMKSCKLYPLHSNVRPFVCWNLLYMNSCWRLTETSQCELKFRFNHTLQNKSSKFCLWGEINSWSISQEILRVLLWNSKIIFQA
jgi:hypothetical protein